MGSFPISSSKSIKINPNSQLRAFRFRSLSARWTHTHKPPQRETKKETPSLRALLSLFDCCWKYFPANLTPEWIWEISPTALFLSPPPRVCVWERRLLCTCIYTQRNNLAAPLHPRVGRALCVHAYNGAAQIFKYRLLISGWIAGWLAHTILLVLLQQRVS